MLGFRQPDQRYSGRRNCLGRAGWYCRRKWLGLSVHCLAVASLGSATIPCPSSAETLSPFHRSYPAPSAVAAVYLFHYPSFALDKDSDDWSCSRSMDIPSEDIGPKPLPAMGSIRRELAPTNPLLASI